MLCYTQDDANAEGGMYCAMNSSFETVFWFIYFFSKYFRFPFTNRIKYKLKLKKRTLLISTAITNPINNITS